MKVELILEQDAIVPHGKTWVGIRVDLQDGWHTYWVNPGDSGEPPRIEWGVGLDESYGPGLNR